MGAGVFLVGSGLRNARSLGPEYAGSSRNVYVVGALVLPAVALCADAAARQTRFGVPIVALVLAAGVPGNVTALADRRGEERALFSDYRHVILTIPRLSLAREVPEETRPERWLGNDITMRFLVDEYATGGLPDVEVGVTIRAAAYLHVALEQRSATPPADLCEAVAPGDIALRPGDTMVVGHAPGLVRLQIAGDGLSLPKRIEPARGRALVVLAGPLRVRYEAVRGDAAVSVAICRSP
jgi:hypothetical protein